MDRREALSIASLIVGGSVVGAANFLSGCKPKPRKSIFGMLDNQQVRTIEEVAETILPKTDDSPGAKDVEIGRFINKFITDCYSAEEQKTLVDGITKLNELSIATYNDEFSDLTQEQKHEVLLKLEVDAQAFKSTPKNSDQKHYYMMIKQLSILGYLTSEQVGTKVFNHIPIPGRFEGCIQYKQGDKSFI